MDALVAGDVTVDDRRKGLQVVIRGRAQWTANTRPFGDKTSGDAEVTPLATRGERLALLRQTWCAAAGQLGAPEFDLLSEVDGEGRISRVVIFDADDLDAAFTELDARYLDGEAAPDAATWGAVVEAVAAINRRAASSLSRRLKAIRRCSTSFRITSLASRRSTDSRPTEPS